MSFLAKGKKKKKKKGKRTNESTGCSDGVTAVQPHALHTYAPSRGYVRQGRDLDFAQRQLFSVRGGESAESFRPTSRLGRALVLWRVRSVCPFVYPSIRPSIHLSNEI